MEIPNVFIKSGFTVGLTDHYDSYILYKSKHDLLDNRLEPVTND